MITIFAFGQNNHLEPVRNFNEYNGVLKEYYDNVFPLLYKGFQEKPYARYTAMPSFSSEYAISIEQIDDEFYIITNTLSRNYWYAKNKNRVRVRTKKLKIDESFYNLIGDLFRLIAKQTRKSDDDIVRSDGIIYYFATTNDDNELKIGKTWSPHNNSLMGRLIIICDNLYSIANGGNKSQTEIQSEINRLIEEMME